MIRRAGTVHFIPYIDLENSLFFVQNINGEMGWACGAYGGGERCAQGFGGEA